ncbi:MAG: hypothetical protein QMC79_08245 [Anaerosomatales bacterium]|nr:hypothetical protein [Anaerosomatales bacterium]
MLKLALWQSIVVLVVALAAVGTMTAAVLKMFPQGEPAAGQVRPSTDLEAGFVGATPTAGQHVFDAWSYRVQARYAGRVRVVVDDSTISVAGPRAPFGLYRIWIWLQAITLALVAPALAWAAVKLDWRMLLVAVGLVLVSTAVMAIGAGVWPGMGELPLVAEGHFEATEFDLASVTDVSVGEWATDGMPVVLFPYKAGIDQIAADRTVTFSAPDGFGHHVRYALQMYSVADAEALISLLEGVPAE